MTDPMPSDATTLMRDQAELIDLRWVGLHFLHEHRRSAFPEPCLCPICRAAARWIPLPTQDPFLPRTVPFSKADRR